jgi:hypothetical protein
LAKITDPDSLTYSVNSATNMLRFDTTLKTIELVASGALVEIDGVTGQCLFSKIKEAIKASSLLISVPLPVLEMIHDESMELVNGWTFKNATTVKMIRDCGVAYVNTAGKITAMFACFVTLGAIAAGTAVNADLYYVQSSASDATPAYFTHLNTGVSFGVNELVQIYSDTNGDGTPDYDYRSYSKVFLRRAAYTYDESSSIEIGYPTLTYKKYNFPITHSVDAGVTVSDGTLAGYTGMSITWYAAAQPFSLGANGPYNYHVVIDAGTGTRTYQEVYSWVQYQLRQSSDIDAGAGTAKVGKVAPSLVFMDGAILKTKLQPTGGVHISDVAPASYNNIAEADDTGAYRTYPLSVAIVCEFDSFLQADADSYFWVFATSAYGTPGATPLLDSSSAQIKGAANVASASFARAYSVDVPLTGIALGKSGAKVAIATTTLTNTGAKLVFVAGLERWYANPV